MNLDIKLLPAKWEATMEEIRHNDEMEIDLRELFQILKKRIWMIILITLVATLTSGIISFFVITPIYDSSTDLLVNKSESDLNALFSYNDIQTNLKLIDTYNVIIKSPRIIDLVISRYNLDFSSQELTDKISVKSIKNSQVMSITVTDPDHGQAVMIANAIAETFKKEIVKIMNVDNVQILTQAKGVESPSPIKPKPMLNMVIAFVVGFMTAIGLAFLFEYMDNSIKTESDVERLLGYPVLGSIGIIEERDTKKKVSRKGMTNVPQRGDVHEF